MVPAHLPKEARRNGCGERPRALYHAGVLVRQVRATTATATVATEDTADQKSVPLLRARHMGVKAMSNRNRSWEWEELWAGIFLLLVFIAGLTLIALGSWVAVHFITKYW